MRCWCETVQRSQLTILSPHTLGSVLYICHMRDWCHARNFFAGASQVAFVLSNFGRMDQKIGPRPAMGTRLLVSISQRCDHLLFYLCYWPSRLSAFRVPAPVKWRLLLLLLRKKLCSSFVWNSQGAVFYAHRSERLWFADCRHIFYFSQKKRHVKRKNQLV